MSVPSIPDRLRDEISRGYERETITRRLITREITDLKSVAFWRGVLAEFVGCLIITVFAVGMGLKNENAPDPPLLQGAIASGFLLAIMITSLATVSGANVNPAISVGFLISGHISLVKCVLYIPVQCAGAIAGARLLKAMVPDSFVGSLGLMAPGTGVSSAEALLAEIVQGYFLLFTTLSMLDPGRTDIRGFAPLIGGLIVSVNILYAGNISGGCMNPIRALGPAVVQGKYEHVWIYWMGPMIGSILGSLCYELLFSTHLNANTAPSHKKVWATSCLKALIQRETIEMEELKEPN